MSRERWEEIDESRASFEGRISVRETDELIDTIRSMLDRIAQLEADLAKAEADLDRLDRHATEVEEILIVRTREAHEKGERISQLEAERAEMVALLREVHGMDARDGFIHQDQCVDLSDDFISTLEAIEILLAKHKEQA